MTRWRYEDPDMPDLTPHAAQRAIDMCLDAEEIRALLLRPRDTWPSFKYPGSMIYSNGRVAAAVVDHCVITFLWSRRNGDPRFSRELDDEMRYIRGC